jgi:D-serine deaminase-like pyridoxal phosphate-dependent protein
MASARQRTVADLPTPALIVDLPAFERNVRTMSAYCARSTVALRPHVKTHKCPAIARRQIAAGASGLCAAKLSEAEVFLEAGFTDVLVTTPVVDTARIARLAALAHRHPTLSIVVDRAANIGALSAAADAAGVRLRVLVDLDCGAHRSGVAPGPPAVALAHQIAGSPSLEFLGFQAFASHVVHIDGFAARQSAARAVLAEALESRWLADREGLDVRVFSVGGTGTYNIDAEVRGVTEVQAGSYIFMDVMYRAIGGERGAVFDDFEPSLFVLTTVISQPYAGWATVDAGYKAAATDHQPPEPWDVGDITYRWAGDEHGILTLGHGSRPLTVGDTLRLLPGHCDPTVNLYDRLMVCVGDDVVDEWPITARGRSQ